MTSPPANSALPTAPSAGPYRIVERQDFSSATYLLAFEHPPMARAARAGQFVIVMPEEHGERIPLTIADFDRERGTVTLVIQAVGKTTKAMQRDCHVGSSLYAVVGPMGIPSRIGNKRKVVCVGGGLGVAPVYPQARAWKDSGAQVIGVLGFRNRELMFWDDKFAEVCDELIICTDDGSAGLRGRVTEGLAQALSRHPDVQEVVAIGPPVMMKGCAELTRPLQIPTVVSLNPVMVDGTGMCGGCRVKIGEQIRFACVDGPDFDGHQVDFDDLTARLVRFKRAEGEAMARFEESCRMRDEAERAARAAVAERAAQATGAGPTPAGS